MSVNLASLYAQQYATNIMLLLQQKGSRLRGKVAEKTGYTGEQASPVDQVASVEMQPVTTRFGAMGRVDANVDRRWVAPSSFDLPQLIDTFDKLKMLTDPKSSYVENAVYAAGRQMDRLIITAFFGTSLTGKTGTTSTTFPSTQQVAVNFGASANTGLTVAKLREAKRILMANEVDLENDPIYCAVTATQHDNLLAEAQVISQDYNDGLVLKEGKIQRFLGFDFVHTELLALDTNSYRRVPCWSKSGMHLGIWGDVTTDVDRRKDLQGLPWQIYVYLTAGSCRTEEKKVVEVKCA
jgi:hypothetical protein